MADTTVEYSPGLEGVIAGRTGVCEINEERASLTYRGYDIRDLAVKSTYEETAYLLLHGRLPKKSELDEFAGTLRAERAVPGDPARARSLFLETRRHFQEIGSKIGVTYTLEGLASLGAQVAGMQDLALVVP